MQPCGPLVRYIGEGDEMRRRLQIMVWFSSFLKKRSGGPHKLDSRKAVIAVIADNETGYAATNGSRAGQRARAT